jgi:hypothetical protein
MYRRVALNYKVHIYLEHHNVCPLIRFGPPQPLSRNQVCPPPHPDPKGEGTHSPGGGRVGAGPNSVDLEKKPSTLSTLYIKFTKSRVFM